MKLKILSELPRQSLGQTNICGKVLTFLEDKVGFFMAQFDLAKDEQHELIPAYENHNHVYYCIKGKSCVDVNGIQYTLTDNTLLALNSVTKASINALDQSRIVMVSVPALSNSNPPPYFLRLDQVVGTARDVDFGAGQSRRFLKESDGFNVSVTNTMPSPCTKVTMQYKNHFEAILLCRGRIQYWWNEGSDTVVFDENDTATRDGVFCLFDQHDRHQNEVTSPEANHIVCVFFPALKGDEKHDFSGKEGSSY